MNPYEAANPDSSPVSDNRRWQSAFTKRNAWNAFLFLIAALLLADNYSRFLPNLTRLFTHSSIDLDTFSSLAKLTGLFTPVFVLVAFSSVFLTKQRVAIRLPFLIPVFSILMHSVPPRSADFILLVVYLLAVSSILFSGIGWPAIIQSIFRRYRIANQTKKRNA